MTSFFHFREKGFSSPPTTVLKTLYNSNFARPYTSLWS